MFPPIEDAVLQGNPKFAALHKTLTTRILNPDGSSKTLPTADREATAETLHAHRIRATKAEILCSALSSLQLTKQTPPLPPELLELIVLLSLQLCSTTPLAAPSLALLESSPPYTTLDEHLPRLGALLSTHLHAHALSLTRLLNPTTNASFLHRKIPTLAPALQALQADLAAQKERLHASRLALVPLVTRVLDLYRQAAGLAIQVLEQNKHGPLARGVRARAELLSAEATQEECNARLVYATALNTIYTPEVLRALKNYAEHLRDGRSRLRQRQKDAERELERYGVGREGKEKVMKEIARVYGEMGKQIREVKKDMDRLKGA